MHGTSASPWCWAQLVACCLLCAFAFALPLPCFGVFVSPMVETFGSSVTEVNLYFTFMTAAAVVSCAVGERILDKWMRPTVIICVFAMAGAYAALALVPSISMVWLAGTVAGLCYPLCTSILVPIHINRWFSKQQGTFIGISFALVGLSGMVFGPVLTAGIAGFGWRATLAGAAVAMLAVCVAVAVFLLRPDPASVGVGPYGGVRDARKTIEAREGGGARSACVPYFGIPFAFAALAALLSGVLGDLNTQVNAVALQSGFDAVTAGVAFSFISGGLVVGKVALGSIRDAKGSAVSISFGCVCGVIAFVLLAFSISTDRVVPLFVASALAGVCTCLGTVAPALLASDAFDPRHHARAVGHLTAFCNAGMAVGAPLYSLSFDLSGSYLPITLSLCAIAVLTAIASLVSVRARKAAFVCSMMG